MKFSANLSMLFTEVPLLARFHAARQAGFQAVEIQFPYDVPIAELQQAQADAGVEVVLINIPAGDLMRGGDGLACHPERQQAYRAALAQGRDYASALGVQYVNVLAGRQPQGLSREACLAVLYSNLQATLDTFADTGITVLCEAINHYDMERFLLHRAEHLWEVLAQFPQQNLKAQYDLYHMARMGEDLGVDLALHATDIGHIQFADVPLRHEPGTGSLDFSSLFAAIEQSAYQGYLGAEYRPSQVTEKTLQWFTP